MLFIDIDGTTFYTPQQKVLASTYTALEKLKQNGVKIFINSSRSFDEMINLDARFLSYMDGISTCAGALMMLDGKIFSQEIAHYQEIISNFEKEQITYRYVTADNHGYLNQKNIKVEQLFNRLYNYIPPVKPYHGEKIIHLLYYPKDNDVHYEKKYPHLFKDNTVIVFSNAHECLHHTRDKGSVIEMVCKYYGASIVDTYAIGDGTNDIDMLKKAHVGIAMGNGKPALKAVSDYVTASIEEDGFLKAMLHYKLI